MIRRPQEQSLSAEDDDSDSLESSEETDTKKKAPAKKASPARKKAPPKKRAKKDPNAPKPATTAYMCFAKEKRQDYKSEDPAISFGELNKKIAVAWKALSEEEKEPYVKESKRDKARFLEEMKSYQKASNSSSSESGDDSDDKKKRKTPKKKRATKDPNAPKAATNAYMLFQKDKREEIKRLHPELRSVTEVAKKCGEVWRGLSDEEKKVYTGQADKDRIRYKKEMEAYTKEKEEYEDANGEKDESESESESG